MQIETYELERFPSEHRILSAFMSDELYGALMEEGCIIAGGAITSIFTNRPVNDIDVYFPSYQAFQNIMFSFFNLTERYITRKKNFYGGYYMTEDDGETLYDLGFDDGKVSCITSKSVMLKYNETLIQFINYAWFQTPEELFKKYDFVCNMGAFSKEKWHFHQDFLKHNAQRYLKFNPETSYPLVSAMRVQKYKDKGYTISKSEFMRIMLAVNRKEINSWAVLFDELGGMYGTQPEQIFDTTKEFSLDYAIQCLDDIRVTEHMSGDFVFGGDFAEIVVKQPHAFGPEIVKIASELKPSVKNGLYLT